jgi:hypothetical protein
MLRSDSVANREAVNTDSGVSIYMYMYEMDIGTLRIWTSRKPAGGTVPPRPPVPPPQSEDYAVALPEIRGTVRLLTQPSERSTKDGKPWCSAIGLFETWAKTDSGWEQTDGVPVTIATFDQDCAHFLAGLGKGDKVCVHGTCRPEIYNDKPQLKITATRAWLPVKEGS